MRGDTGRKMYEHGVALADEWAAVLSKSVKVYASMLKLKPAPDDRARQAFWSRVEQHVPVLLALADKPEQTPDLKQSEWGRHVRQSALDAFEFACAHETPRQIQAHAAGLQQLFLRKPKAPSATVQKKSKARQPA
jgi:hypothetical protein